MKRHSPFWLRPDTPFPAPELADEQGLLAIGADLSPGRLLDAYKQGIFPWPALGDGAPMLWFSPDPRFVLYPNDLHVGRSLRRAIGRATGDGGIEVRYDTSFVEVVRSCALTRRPDQEGTWISDELGAAYGRLHELGFAHSVEAWQGKSLVGGLYGVSLGGIFFGESMFSRRPNASKIAFVHLVERLANWGFGLIDCQVETDHLTRFGAVHVSRRRFLDELAELLRQPSRLGSWTL